MQRASKYFDSLIRKEVAVYATLKYYKIASLATDAMAVLLALAIFVYLLYLRKRRRKPSEQLAWSSESQPPRSRSAQDRSPRIRRPRNRSLEYYQRCYCEPPPQPCRWV
ncbi:unnamed protein product [Calicophoron daubneyi]|uniref:Uncharacterized protein n=1 Tax=Calicophoron daubneyi TaxID=300641 RepID=A0AAV2TSJ0_CALDB